MQLVEDLLSLTAAAAAAAAEGTKITGGDDRLKFVPVDV
jgi:hypothetical protein